MDTDEYSYQGEALHILPADFVIFDLETTGLQPKSCRIIELAALKVSKGRIVQKYNTLVNSHIHIPHKIQMLTGITDDMVQHGCDERYVIQAFDLYAGNLPLMAYNANFDIAFLSEAYGRLLHKPLVANFIDLLPMTRKAFPDMKHHRLENLCEALSIDNEHAHRAVSDVHAELLCYIAMKPILIQKFGSEEAYSASFAAQKGTRATTGIRQYNRTVEDFISSDEPTKSHDLSGKNVAFTGHLQSLSRKDAQEVVRHFGGLPQKNVTQQTDYLVIGDNGYVGTREGDSTKVQKAKQNIAKGLPTKIISESQFISMLED